MNLQETLHDWQNEIAASLAEQMDGQTLCQLHHDGRVTGGVKYDEGRLAALTALLRKWGEGDTQRLAEQEMAHWQAQLERYQAMQPPPLHWVAYNQGGVDLLERFLSDFF